MRIWEASCDASINDASSCIRSNPEVNSSYKGILKVDATYSDAEMRYPTDIDLLHDNVEVLGRIIDHICKEWFSPSKNPSERDSLEISEYCQAALQVKEEGA
jgi:hypothetical protein